MEGGTSTASAPTASPSDYPPGYLQEDRSGILTNTVIGLFIATTLAVFLRTASRRVQWSGWMWGDIFIPISYLCMIGLFVCSILCVQNGAGKHIVTVPPDQLIRFLILTHYPLPLIYLFAAFVPKLAILEIYIRFFLLDRIPRYITYGVAAIMIANAIVNIPFVAGQCEPVAYLWDKSIPGGYCNHAQEHFLWGSVANVVTDLIMMFLPMPLVLKLQSSKKVKWGIFTTFAVGSIGLIFSILRFFGFDVQYKDGTFIAPTVIISALVETSVYLICACFFTYRPLFRRIAQMTAFAPFPTRITSRRTKSSQLSETSAHTGMDPRSSGSGPWTRLESIVGGNKARSPLGHDQQRPGSGEIGVAMPMVSLEAGASRVADRKSKSGFGSVTVQAKDGDEEDGLSFEDMMKMGARR